MTIARRWFCCCLFLFVLHPFSAIAAEKTEKKEVSDEFIYEEEPLTPLQQAQAVFEKEDWSQAIPLFQKIVDNPQDKQQYEQALYALATCYEKTGDLKKAVFFYKGVLRQGQTEELKDKAKQRVDFIEDYVLDQFHVGKWVPKLWMYEKTEALAKEHPEYEWHFRVGLPYLILIGYKFLLLLAFLAILLIFSSTKAMQSPRRLDIGWGIPSIFGVYVLFLILQVFVVYLLKPALKSGESDFVNLLFELILSYLILTTLVLLVLTWRGIPWRKLGIDADQFSRNILLAAKYMAAMAVLFGIYSFLRSNDILKQDKIIHLYPLSSVGSIFHLLQVFLLVVVSPISEEIFYRGFVYPVARNRTGVLGGILLTSLFFSLIHVDPRSTLVLFIISLVLCYLYEKSRNLIPAICVHAFYNFIVLFGGSFLPSTEICHRWISHYI